MTEFQFPSVDEAVSLVKDLVKAGRFRMFTEQDWYGFAGCTSMIPLIAEIQIDNDLSFLVIIDGETIEFQWTNFERWSQGPVFQITGNNESGWSEQMRMEPFDLED